MGQTIKILAIAFLILSSIDFLNAQPYVHPKNSDPGFLTESEHFRFYSHLWLNMHHFLYNKALSYRKSGIEAAIEQDKWKKLNQNERQIIETILKFYSEKITHQDLRTGEYNYKFKRWVVQFSNENPLPSSDEFVEHSRLLNNVQVIYLNHFWVIHHSSNKRVLEENIGLIRKYENKFTENLTQLCKAEWQNEKIRIDISFHSKRDIPYTTTRPTTHIIMDSRNSNSLKGNWFELLLHEASHHLIKSSSGFVGGTISNVTAVLNSRRPGQLWHAYLFYFSGRVAQNLLKEEGMTDYELYMVRNNVFASSFPFLDGHLSRYLSNELNLAEATRLIIESISVTRVNTR